jgi:hypothetical protein
MRLSEPVYVNAIDASAMVNPVDHSGGFGGFRRCVLARAANIFLPLKRGLLFWLGRVANPPNPETQLSVLSGSGWDALAGLTPHAFAAH